MNLLVCIKQVPDTTEIRIDPETNTLIRSGVPSIVNPFDAYALEAAARIKDEKGGRVTVISMGPPQAKEALIECLSVGADKAFLVSDRAFSGSDTLATSYILANAIRAVEAMEGKFDIIFCGKQAIDGDTAQVGPEIAEHLDLPQVTYAVAVEATDGRVVAKRENDDGYALIEMFTPCLVTVTKPAFDPRLPTIRSKMAAKKAEIVTITSQDIELDLTQCGLKGSPTKVKKTFTPEVKKGGVRIVEADDAAAGRKLAELLINAKVI
jgi:electron transfer flavoprotein beta subunit